MRSSPVYQFAHTRPSTSRTIDSSDRGKSPSMSKGRRSGSTTAARASQDASGSSSWSSRRSSRSVQRSRRRASTTANSVGWTASSHRRSSSRRYAAVYIRRFDVRTIKGPSSRGPMPCSWSQSERGWVQSRDGGPSGVILMMSGSCPGMVGSFEGVMASAPARRAWADTSSPWVCSGIIEGSTEEPSSPSASTASRREDPARPGAPFGAYGCRHRPP